MTLVHTKLRTTTSSGTPILVSATLEYKEGRIFFVKSPYSLKDEIKAMAGSRWHGYDEENPQKMWSVEDCQRNRFQLSFLMGEDVYAWFDRPRIFHEYTRPLREHQKELSDNGLTYHYHIFAAGMGTGKGGLPTTKVAIPSGWTTFGEIRVGDTIINPEGGHTRVKGVYRRGVMEMFRVTFSDGASTVCSGDHLWNVRTPIQKWRGQDYRTLELQDIVRRGLCYDNGNALHYIPMVAPVEYESATVPVRPYLAGYILGNGGLTGWTNKLSIPDEETVNRLNGMMKTPLKPCEGSEYDYHLQDSDVNAWLDLTGLRGCLSPDKHVPDAYQHLGVADRLALLQGLCDSDGHAVATGGVEFSTTSASLRDTFVGLIQSFGGTCHVAEKCPTYTYAGEQRVGRLAYRIYAALPAGIRPFWLSRKAGCYVVPTKYQPTRAIECVESVGEHECICISVEAENGLYVTDDFIVTHNTLAAQEVIERSGVDWGFWVGPKTSIPNIKREFRIWKFPHDRINIEFFTYEGLKSWVESYKPGDPFPALLICDESSRCKNTTSQRSRACQALANMIREKYGLEHGYVIEMSGTPAPKNPTDWWSQCEIAWPGFLREGSPKAMEDRMAFMVMQQLDEGSFKKRVGWKDDERKCAVCGETREGGPHELDGLTDPEEYHDYVPSKNEVAYLYERLKGLVTIKHKKDCLSLPEKRYRRMICKPSKSILRVAESVMASAPNAVTGVTLLRELSDGFQYREEQDGMTRCTHCKDGMVSDWFDPANPDEHYAGIDMLPPEVSARLVEQKVPCPVCGGSKEVPKFIRIARELPCPKDAALRMLLDENEETGRLVVFAGFTGSVDKVVRLCLKEKWNVVRCDQGSFQVFTHDGAEVTEEPLDYWANMDHARVAFCAHPESGGMSLTLVEARTAVYWSNSWKPEYRAQSEDRIHRMGMDLNKGCLIVDLIHLPTDVRVLDVICENRRLELMTMGEFAAGIEWEAAGDGDGEGGGIQIVEAVL